MSGGPWEDFKPAQSQTDTPPWLDFAPKVSPAVADAPAAGQPGDASAAVGRGMLNGVPIVGPYLLSGAEHAAAGIRSLKNDTKFSDELKNVQGFSEATAAAHPNAELGGEIAGGVVGTLPAIAAAPAAFGAGTAALPVRAGLSMATGGAIGGADTAARGGDVQQIEKGAALGAGLGAAAPVAGAVVGKAVGAVVNRATSGENRLLQRAMTADALTPDTAQARLAELGDAGMLADLGPNLQRQAGALAATPGEAQQVVRGAIADRMQGAGARTTEAADRALGQPQDAISTMDRLIQERRAAAEPLYLDAYTKPMPQNGRVDAALNTPAGQAAWKKAEMLASNEGIPIDPTKPTVRALDLTKRALDDMVDSAQRSGNKNEARVLGGVKNLLLSGVDAVVPEYAAAREAFASHAALQDAFEAGQALFERKTTPGQIAQMMKGMSDGERELMQEGARSALADLMGTARNDALKARQTFDQGYNREKLGQLIGKDQADALISDLGNEATFARTQDVVTGNSETAARAAAMQEIGGNTTEKAGIIRSLLNLHVGDAAREAARKVTGSFADQLRERRNADLAQILMEVGPDRAGAQRAFAAIGRSVRAKDISSDVAHKLMNAAVRGGGQQALGGVAGLPAR